MGFGAIAAAKKDVSQGASIDVVGNAMFKGLFLFWGIGYVLLGSAMVMQKNLHVAVGWLFVIFGALMVILTGIDLDIADNIGLVIWFVLTITIVAAGVLTLRAKQAS